MRRRRLRSAAVYGACVATVLGALVWLTAALVDLERRERAAKRETLEREAVRVALWRIDSALSPFLTQEAARPFFHYRAFWPAANAIEGMFRPVAEGEDAAVSPLLLEGARWCVVHFQISADGQLISPNVPMEWERGAAARAGLGEDHGASRAGVLTVLRDAAVVKRIEGVASGVARPGSATAWGDAAEPRGIGVQTLDGSGSRQNRNVNDANVQTFVLPGNDAEADAVTDAGSAESGDELSSGKRFKSDSVELTEGDVPMPPGGAASDRDRAELGADDADGADGGAQADRGVQRQTAGGLSKGDYQQRKQQVDDVVNQMIACYVDPAQKQAMVEQGSLVSGWVSVDRGASRGKMAQTAAGFVVGEQSTGAEQEEDGAKEDGENGGAGAGERLLVFVRPVWIGETRIVQGAVVDWASVKREMLDRVADVLPGADLVESTGREGDDEYRLASLPVVLVPGQEIGVGGGGVTRGAAAGGAGGGATIAAVSPTRVTLIVTWAAVLAATVAIGLVVRTLIELGERRGRFVSAVTHELRTPLTTFCLYSEMLADGLVKEESDRREYLRTLKSESRRLARIVENVLSYAKLSDMPARAHVGRVDAGEVFASVLPRLTERAGESGMRIVPGCGAEGAMIEVDTQSVERILLNLVDNACKYASDGERREIEVSVEAQGVGAAGVVVMRVADFGPGIEAGRRRAVFRPFRRGSDEESISKPGLGIGLTLARELAIELGGELRLVSRPPAGYGAVFELELPRVG